MVVALICFAGGGDGVVAHGLAGFTAQGVGDIVAVQGTGNRRGQLGIIRTEHLGLVIGGDGHLCRVDGQGVGILSGLVVGVLRLHGDVHGAHILDGGEVGRPLAVVHAVGDGGAVGDVGGCRVTVGSAVIDAGVILAVDGHRAAGGDGQGALHVGDGVVLRQRCGGQGVTGDGIVAGADVGLAAHHGDGGKTLAVHEAALRDGVTAIRQGGAVVSLAVAVCGQLDLPGSNGKGVLCFRCVVVGVGGTNLDGLGAHILDGGNLGRPLAVVHAVGDGGARRHVGGCHRAVGSAVIGAAVALNVQGHRAAGVDGQRSGGNLRNNVLFRGIHSTLSALAEVHGILSGVGARAGSGYALEGRQGAHGFGSKAGHGVLVAIVSPGIRVGGQLYILIVVEGDYILAGANGDGLAGITDRGAARNSDGRLFQRLLEGQARNSLGFTHRLRGSVPVVVHGCGQVGAFGVVQVDHVLAGSNGQGILIGAVVGIAIDFNGFIGSRYGGSEGHAILYLLVMQNLVGALLQIVHPIAQVGADGEGAGDGHVLGGHGEIRLAPAGESIAGCGGRGSYGHAFVVLVGCLGGQGSGVCGTRADVLVGHGVAVPGVVQLQNQTAVTGNGAALHGSFYRLVEGESGNALFFSRHDRAGGTAAGHRCFQLVSTVQIFQIVLYLVGSIAVRSVGDNDYFIVIRHVAVNSRLIHRVTGNNRRLHVIAFVVVQCLGIGRYNCTASLIHVANGQGVAVNREATRNCNIIRRHLEGAIPIPTAEGIAQGGGIRCHGHFRTILIAGRFRQFTCALGCSAIVIGNRVGNPVVLNFNHSTSIGRNCLLLKGLGCETIVLFCLSGSLCTGGAFLSFTLVHCISGAIQIFPQMHHGIFGVRCGFPLGDIGHGAGNGFGNLRVPAHEGIAGTDRIISPERGG